MYAFFICLEHFLLCESSGSRSLLESCVMSWAMGKGSLQPALSQMLHPGGALEVWPKVISEEKSTAEPWKSKPLAGTTLETSGCFMTGLADALTHSSHLSLCRLPTEALDAGCLNWGLP